MSSSNGVTYYSKSMNGLVTFETGSGLVLEGDSITADTITCSTLNTDTFGVTTLTADYATITNNITAQNVIVNDGLYGVNTTTDKLTVNNLTTLHGNTTADILTITNYIKTSKIVPPNLISDIQFFYNTTLPILLGQFKFTSQTFQPSLTNTDVSICTDLASTATLNLGNTGVLKLGNIIKVQGTQIFGGAINDTMSLFPTQTGGQVLIGNLLTTGSVYIGGSMTSTGTVYIGNLGTTTIEKIKITGQNINPVVNSTASNCFTTCTADTKFGGTGTIFIGQNKSGGFIAMGGGCQTIMNGELICHQTLTLDNSTAVNVVSSASAPVNLFNTATTATINICNGLTTGTVNMGGSGTVAISGKFQNGTNNILGYSRFANFAATNTITPPINIDYFVIVTGTLASTVNLPSYINGQKITIRNSKTAVVGVTVQPVSGQNILNLVVVTSYTLAQGSSVTLYCDGTRWIIIFRN